MQKRTRILVVDDEENVRCQLSSLFNIKGFQADTAANAEQALVACQKNPPDIVLCDVRMPGMSGMEFLEKIGGAKTEAEVIMMSAYGDIDLAQKAVRHGASDYISKPYKNEEVLLRISIAEQRRKLRQENLRLKQVIQKEVTYENIIGKSSAMQNLFKTIDKIAEFKSTVLISGESGTGKELLARALHNRSQRRKKPFVAINCGAIPENLLESELFGYVRGAFTDAVRNKAGLFEEADTGTLFLDEIGELPIGLQVKLLRVLQEDEIRRVGENRSRKVDVRILAATIRDLSEEVKHGRFREDLFYRLNVLTVKIPPLRERPGDIPLLLEHFLIKCNTRLGTDIKRMDSEALRLFVNYSWPGNVRELENMVERAVILCDGDVITPDLLTEKVAEMPTNHAASLPEGQFSIKKTVQAIEEELIKRALAETGGNRTRAARILEISHRTLLYKLKDYRIDANDFRSKRKE